MIIFEKLRYKNFLSTGDHFTEFDLRKANKTLVIGKNGEGKSTFIDALVYALFGKPFRKVKLGMLINNVNEKGLLVEIEFSIKGKKYLVRRGMKPSVFEIYVDGEMIEQPGSNADYQDILANEILKISYKTFTQIVILGSASYKPFMELSLGDRREIIETLLDIGIFSEMNVILKANIKDTKAKIVDLEHRAELAKQDYQTKYDVFLFDRNRREKELEDLETEIGSVKEKTDAMRKERKAIKSTIKEMEETLSAYEDTEERNTDLEVVLVNYKSAHDHLKKEIDAALEANSVYLESKTSLDDLEKERFRLYEEISKKEKEMEFLLKKMIDLTGIEQRRQEILVELGQIDTKMQNAQNRLIFYRKNDSCPECGQGIGKAVRDENIAQNETILDNLNELIGLLESERDNIDKIIVEQDQIQLDANSIGVFINELKHKVSLIEKDIALHQDRLNGVTYTKEEVITEMLDEVQRHESDIAKIMDEIKLYQSQKDTKEYLDKEYQSKIARLGQIETALEMSKDIRKNLRKKLAELKESPVSTVSEGELERLKVRIAEYQEELKNAKQTLHYFNITLGLLKDDGIKVNIIRQFLPLINSVLNMYLDKFDFPINFMFDEKFVEKIESNFRSEFSYYSFSEGEKARINIAILFTWREIALKKSRNSTNLLIFDEVFDGSLDDFGVDNFMSILGADDGSINSFIITHDDSVKLADFDRIMKFEKQGHFSRMAEQ